MRTHVPRSCVDHFETRYSTFPIVTHYRLRSRKWFWRKKLDQNSWIVDADRTGFLTAYIGALNQAVSLGADVRGYFV
jgi:beta-glucosidase/6-phospho-beta-glucosidase/beta-galactosidase